jgi:peptide/nickel transport system permease protein
VRRFLLFAAKRLLLTIPQLFVVSVIVFFLIRLLPGDPSYTLAGPYASPDRIAEVRQGLGLDEPIISQYIQYLGRVFAGDFGTSWRTRSRCWPTSSSGCRPRSSSSSRPSCSRS